MSHSYKRESRALYKFYCVTLISQARLISRNSEQGCTLECLLDCTLDCTLGGTLDIDECIVDSTQRTLGCIGLYTGCT